MGFNNFWNDRADAANEFLRTGQARDKSILARDNAFTARSNASAARSNASAAGNNALNTGASCVSTSQCPSGWGCVNGVCQQLNNGSSGGSNSPGGGGDCDPDNPESPCNSGGPNSCQQTPQCGDTDDEARDCCGTRCCSFGSASSTRPGVHCFCGECPPWPGCTRFCESYLKSNGEVGPGCAEGADGNSCDSCTECDGNVGGGCKPISVGAPCWCEGEECSAGNCEKCVTDENSPDFGDCALDPSDCQQCTTITNHLCPCNLMLSPVTVCKPYGEGGLLPINLAQQEAAARCSAACASEPDPCLPKTSSSTYCTDTGTGTASCPEGTTQTGSLSAGGEACVFCETADYSDLPDSCKECDCNCHNDCPDCQLCGADGKCYPDPACEQRYYTVIGRFTWFRLSTGCSGGVCQDGICDWYGPTNRLTTPIFFSGDFEDENDLGPGYQIKEGEVWGPGYASGCGAALDCPEQSYYTNLYGVRSDGVTPTRIVGMDGFMFDRVWCYNRSFSTWSDRSEPGELIVKVGYGNNPIEALEDAENQLPPSHRF